MAQEVGKNAAVPKAPRIVRAVAELRSLADGERAAKRRIALVPTMGALHAGHLALVRAARARADRVWVSIFVNPTQFGPNEDFARYPRPFDQDVALCAEAGVDLVFAPSAEEMYPPGAQTTVEVRELAKPLCGASRPTHFQGVATVVSKLFAAAKPHVAVFGEKDFQQLALVRRLVRDLLLDVEIVGVGIVRERDGLALSSRNALLALDARPDALCLVRALDAAEAAVAGGEDAADELLRIVRCVFLEAPRAELEYAELRDPGTLEAAPQRLCGPTLLALAARLPSVSGGPTARVRLIDNRVLHPKPGLEERP
ncbi:MAG TPA: pantoate--beta-alanine ligase [Myxococcota bacterium]|nr:pantoate--beta-alanine ligase [Myxococcota bacterium]